MMVFNKDKVKFFILNCRELFTPCKFNVMVHNENNCDRCFYMPYVQDRCSCSYTVIRRLK
jgi:hypothetical protein